MVTIRHVSNDEVVAFVEIVSPGSKDSRRSIRAFVDKVAGLLEQGIHARSWSMCFLRDGAT
jgi:hypothetical protein